VVGGVGERCAHGDRSLSPDVTRVDKRATIVVPSLGDYRVGVVRSWLQERAVKRIAWNTMADARTFTMTVSVGEVVDVQLGGWITETSNLDLSKIPAGPPVTIDVGDVRVINSIGCRDWMQFLTAVCSQSPSVTIRRLSPMFAFHASTIRNLLARAQVESMLLPWACSACEHYVELLQDAKAKIPATSSCPKCRGEMVLDTFTGVYDNIENLRV